MPDGTQPALPAVVERAVEFRVRADTQPPVAIRVEPTQGVGHHAVRHVGAHRLVEGGEIPVAVVGHIGREADEARLDLGGGRGRVPDPSRGPLDQAREPLVKEGAVRPAHLLFRLERISHADPVIPLARDRIRGEQPRQRQLESADVDAERGHDEVHPVRAAVLIVARRGRDADRLSGNRGVVVDARGERIGQEILLRTVELRSEIPTRTEVDVGIEPAIGPRLRVLAVAPADKELGASGRSGVARGATRNDARPRQLEVAIEPIPIPVLRRPCQAPGTAAV